MVKIKLPTETTPSNHGSYDDCINTTYCHRKQTSIPTRCQLSSKSHITCIRFDVQVVHAIIQSFTKSFTSFNHSRRLAAFNEILFSAYNIVSILHDVQ